MIAKPQRYFVSIGLLLASTGLALHVLVGERGAPDFLVGFLVGAGLALEVVGVWMTRRAR